MSDQNAPWRRRYLLPGLVALGFLILQFIASPGVVLTNDSYRYARATLQILGDSRAEAQSKALELWCADAISRQQRERELDPRRFRENLPAGAARKCVTDKPGGLSPNMPRYEAIFDSRVGYPLLSAPLSALLGVKAGLYLTSLLFTMAGGLLAYVLLRSAGVPPPFAAVGQAIYYATPIGLWGSHPLTEGPTIALTMGALLGAWWMMHRRPVPGATLLVGCLVLGFVVKYSSLLLVAGAIVVAGIIALWRSPSTRHSGTYAMLAVTGAWAAAAAAGARVLGFPGISETLQDTFTTYFTRPDVDDPWIRLAELNVNYWTQWFQEQARAPWLLLVVGAAGWALFRRDTVLAWLVCGIALTGPATVAAHPVASQSERLMEALWIAPVVGLPLLLHWLWSHRPPSDADATVVFPAMRDGLPVPRQRSRAPESVGGGG